MPQHEMRVAFVEHNASISTIRLQGASGMCELQCFPFLCNVLKDDTVTLNLDVSEQAPVYVDPLLQLHSFLVREDERWCFSAGGLVIEMDRTLLPEFSGQANGLFVTICS